MCGDRRKKIRTSADLPEAYSLATRVNIALDRRRVRQDPLATPRKWSEGKRSLSRSVLCCSIPYSKHPSDHRKVTVTGHVDQKKVLKAVRRTGRRAVLWPYQYSAEQHHTFSHQYHQHHPALSQAGVSGPSSSYNYYKHGYDDSRMHGYYQQSAMAGNRTGDIFSDENPNACSVM
ncbi:hypothetical protein GW17_00050709 [Ensete ventricosum]|nr:hypothetical protein GW17_00050709 [Ensete ventricosum]RZS16561.1 hypothetical protein BHM03_00048571 [Ensete ventricosum]